MIKTGENAYNKEDFFKMFGDIVKPIRDRKHKTKGNAKMRAKETVVDVMNWMEWRALVMLLRSTLPCSLKIMENILDQIGLNLQHRLG